MANSKRTDYAKCTVWTPQMKAEIAGSRLGCAIEMFRSLDLQQMPKAIEEMQKIYEVRKGKE